MTGAAYGAYEGFIHPGQSGGGRVSAGRSGTSADWTSFEARKARSAMLWAAYQQTMFRDALNTTFGLRETYGTYKGIRDLFGVSYRLGEFWTSHLQGGNLDPNAGDGQSAPSALPIIMEADKPLVREALAELWKRSNWNVQKSVSTRQGGVTGDVNLEICDDADAATIRLKVVPGDRLKWCDLSSEDNVEAYELEFMRPDPRQEARAETKDSFRRPFVRYNEVVTPDPKGVGYRWRTYLDGNAYVWPGNPSADWVVGDLPFAPFVRIQHQNVGLGWGVAESLAALGHMRECADLASCMTDWCRRALFSPYMLAGVEKPADDIEPAEQSWDEYALASQANREGKVRNSSPYLYVPTAESKAFSLLHQMPIADMGGQIDRVWAKLLGDYPELSFERIRASGDASAEAIREARKPAAKKVTERRAEYDAGSERAFKMAVTMGGLRGYRHYESFNAASYDDGDLDFRIGPRPAFETDPTEETAERNARYLAITAATGAGLPLKLAMREAGYSDADIADAEAEAKAKQEQAMELARSQGPPKPFGGKGDKPADRNPQPKGQ